MVTFYNCKKREKVEIDESKCMKKRHAQTTSKGTRYTYSVSATDEDGSSLYKFLSADAYEKLNCPAAN